MGNEREPDDTDPKGILYDTAPVKPFTGCSSLFASLLAEDKSCANIPLENIIK